MKPGISYRIHKGSPIIHILSQIYPIPLEFILILSSQLRLDLPKGLFPID